MKKIKLISVFVLFILAPLNSLDFENIKFNGGIEPVYKEDMIYESMSYYYFNNGSYKLWHSLDWVEPKNRDVPDQYIIDIGYLENGDYSLRSLNEFNYINFVSNNDFTLKEELGVLFHPRCLALYDKDMLYFISNDGIRYDGHGPRVNSVSSSSYLTEGQTEYKGINIKKPYLEKLKPWVEGVRGYGIGEWIEIDTESPSLPVSFFLISNGFVSFEKPYLYDSNSRVKRLRVTSEELGIDFEVELEDTPDFQEIRLPKTITEKVASFRFTIQEVYEGTKWDDTCINLIIPFADIP